MFIKRRTQQARTRSNGNTIHHGQMSQGMTHGVLATTSCELGLGTVRHSGRVTLLPAKKDAIKVKTRFHRSLNSRHNGSGSVARVQRVESRKLSKHAIARITNNGRPRNTSGLLIVAAFASPHSRGSKRNFCHS